jgi:DNA repair photolyase
MNLYRGCEHNCVYCDGRSEKYQVTGDFGKEIIVKTNAIELLEKELCPKPRKQPLRSCYMMLGGGVGDSYQPVEKKYKLTQQTLRLLRKYQIPVSILTKSTLIKRDLNLLKEINANKRVLINFSFSSTNDDISSYFEPNVPLPSDRLATIRLFKEKGFSCGIFLMPVIPFITDTLEIMKQTIKDAYDVGVDYIIFGGMTLKKGKQKEYFYQKISERYHDLLNNYDSIYRDNQWGQASNVYYKNIHKIYNSLMKTYGIPRRIPSNLFSDILSENDLISVILDQMDYLLKIEGKKSPYGYAAYNISQLKKPISLMINEQRSIPGVGKFTEKIIHEILKKKTCSYYQQLLYS